MGTPRALLPLKRLHRVTVAHELLMPCIARTTPYGPVLCRTQDDVLYETLTVYETLLYSGLLRLPHGMPGEEKRRRVEAVMAGLGLRRSRDTIIGGFFRRGISGALEGCVIELTGLNGCAGCDRGVLQARHFG